MKQDLYSHRSNLIVAFHGCDKSVVERVVLQGDGHYMEVVFVITIVTKRKGKV